MKHDFEIDGHAIKWSYIKQFYKCDSKLSTVLGWHRKLQKNILICLHLQQCVCLLQLRCVVYLCGYRKIAR